MNNSNTINYLQEIDNMLIHFTWIFKYWTGSSSLPISPFHHLSPESEYSWTCRADNTGHKRTLVRLILTDSLMLSAFVSISRILSPQRFGGGKLYSYRAFSIADNVHFRLFVEALNRIQYSNGCPYS